MQYAPRVRFLGALLGFAHFPSCVWAAPSGLIEAVTIAEGLVSVMPDDLSPCPMTEQALHTLHSAVPAVGFTRSSDSPASPPLHCVIFTANFPAQYLLVYARLPCSEEAFCHSAYDLFEHSSDLYELLPTVPQLVPGIATLTAVPRWMRDSDMTVYILDFSFWSGPVYAVADRCYVNLDSLAAAARRHASDSWQVVYDDSGKPLGDGEAVFAKPGQVFRFLPCHTSCPRHQLLRDSLCDGTSWDNCPAYIPRETSQQVWFAMRSHVNRFPVYNGTSFTELCAIAATAFHNDVEELDFVVPEPSSPLMQLVYGGELMRGTLAAVARSPSGERTSTMVFVDPRALGRTPFFHVCSSGLAASPNSRGLHWL